MKTKFIYIILTTLLFSSCGIFNKVIKKENNIISKPKKLDNFLDSVKSNYLDFNTFYTGFSGNFIRNNQKLPLKGLLKIEKDKFIWISVRPVMGIEVSRILITNDSIKYIDKIKNEFFIEDISSLHNKLGFKLDFEILQAILLNQLFFYPSNISIHQYQVNINNEERVLSLILPNIEDIYLHEITFPINNYSIIKNYLNFNEKKQSLNITYSDFSILNKSKRPNSLLIKINDKENNYELKLLYRNIKVNTKLKPTFHIPANFKRVSFE